MNNMKCKDITPKQIFYKKQGKNEEVFLFYQDGKLVWAKPYTVSYKANGGSNAPAPQTKYHTIDLTLSTQSPSRTGYNFNNWKRTNTGTIYSPGATYADNSDAELTAQWNCRHSYWGSSDSPSGCYIYHYCKNCGNQTGSTDNHSFTGSKTNYTSKNDDEHTYRQYCSRCNSYQTKTEYHLITPGGFEYVDSSQHRAASGCSLCEYGTNRLESHTRSSATTPNRSQSNSDNCAFDYSCVYCKGNAGLGTTTHSMVNGKCSVCGYQTNLSTAIYQQVKQQSGSWALNSNAGSFSAKLSTAPNWSPGQRGLTGGSFGRNLTYQMKDFEAQPGYKFIGVYLKAGNSSLITISPSNGIYSVTSDNEAVDSMTIYVRYEESTYYITGKTDIFETAKGYLSLSFTKTGNKIKLTTYIENLPIAGAGQKLLTLKAYLPSSTISKQVKQVSSGGALQATLTLDTSGQLYIDYSQIDGDYFSAKVEFEWTV